MCGEEESKRMLWHSQGNLQVWQLYYRTIPKMKRGAEQPGGVEPHSWTAG